MDAHTLDKLEFDRIRELLAEHASCSLGKGLALRVRPSRRFTQISQWLKQAEQFRQWVDEHGYPPFGGIRDVREAVRRAVPPAKLEPEELAELASTLMGVDAVRLYFADIGEAHDQVARLTERIGDLRVIADRINRVIDSRGRVKDEASDRLFSLREDVARVRDQTREVFERLTRQPGITKYLQYPNATFHADRMVLPLKADQRGRVPGIIHRSSDSGQTVFVEPAEAVELNNRRINLLEAEREEINRILWELTHLVHLNQTEILRTLDAVAVVDLLIAKVRFGRRFGMHFAQLNERHKLRLVQARNPILMAMHEEGVVPIDVRLGEDFDVMIITGPNTGGKTATLKTVGLLALMTQSGLPIPAEAGSTLPVFSGVWIDVGDEQSLEQSLSTFSAHLARIMDILHRARRSTLVLLDEMGAGTDPDEGAAIGRAIVGHLLASGCLAMVTTHLGALKALGYEEKRADNASVQFDPDTLKPTFKLRIGEPGNSNALAIASRLGMPKKLVAAAERHLSNRQHSLQRAIAGTLTARRQAERARREAETARQQAARETLAALDRAKALERQLEVYKQWVKHVIRLQPGDIVRVRGFDDPGRVLRVRIEKQRAAVSIGAKELDLPLSDLLFDGEAK